MEELKGLTLLEASELVKAGRQDSNGISYLAEAIEETFGVDASASAGAVMSAPKVSDPFASERLSDWSEGWLPQLPEAQQKKLPGLSGRCMQSSSLQGPREDRV